MKQFLCSLFLIIACSLFAGDVTSQVNYAKLTNHQVKNWFREKSWLAGLTIQPHKTINKYEFNRQYQLHKTYWDKAFGFLKAHDLTSLAPGKYLIDGENVFASVTADSSKDFDRTNWESHRKYIDVQLIVTGEEGMGVCAVSKANVTKQYDEKRDVANYTAKGKIYNAKAETFFIFFPDDAHRPNITPGGNKVVKKIVIKVKTAVSGVQ